MCFVCSHFTASTIFKLSHFIGLKCYWKWNQLYHESIINVLCALCACYCATLYLIIYVHHRRCTMCARWKLQFPTKISAYVYVIPKIHKRTYLRYITLIGSKVSGLKHHFCWSHVKPSTHVRGNTLTWLFSLSFQFCLESFIIIFSFLFYVQAFLFLAFHFGCLDMDLSYVSHSMLFGIFISLLLFLLHF